MIPLCRPAGRHGGIFFLEVLRENGYHAIVHFVLAQKAGMDLLQRQRLLEMSSENERMEVLRVYFTDVIPRLERMEVVERVIRSDGYL